jgi:hypothetical protein
MMPTIVNAYPFIAINDPSACRSAPNLRRRAAKLAAIYSGW